VWVKRDRGIAIKNNSKKKAQAAWGCNLKQPTGWDVGPDEGRNPDE